MKQELIIQKVTDEFSAKLSSLSIDNGKISVFKDDIPENIDKSLIYLRLLLIGLEHDNSQNRNDKIQQKETDADGNLIEFYVDQPVIINLKYMVTPYCSSINDANGLLGVIIRFIKDEGYLNIEGFSWVNSNNKLLKIDISDEMDLDKQIRLFNLLKLDYKPSLFYQVKVGINSDKKDIFRRVEKKEINMVKMPEKNN